MLICIPFCHKDVAQAKALLEWIADLDGTLQNHSLFLVASSQIDGETLAPLIDLGKKIFGKVDAIKQREVQEFGWPQSPNMMFKMAAEWVKANNRGHFLLLEPDMVPMSSGWLDKLEAEYRAKGRAFMGTIFDRPLRHLNGGMIYPQEVARYNPGMLFATHIPWDMVRPDVTMKHAATTELIQRALANHETNTPHSFPSVTSLSVIRDNAVLFHGCKDGTLIQRLRERKNGQIPFPKTSDFVKKIVKRVQGRSSYYHSGNLGDIIYALNAIRVHGGGELVVGPIQNRTKPCTNAVQFDQFNLLQPLLRAQSYIKKSDWRANHPGSLVEHDLNHFRDLWFNPGVRQSTKIDNLCKMHFHELEIAHLFDERESWLTVPNPIWTGLTVINRSPRHLSTDFPWKQLIDRFGQQMLFVGFYDEWQTFQKDFNCRVSFWAVRDFLEMASLIAGAQCFIGNQSFPLSLAIGMGQRAYCEAWPTAADCYFNRPTLIDQRKHGASEFEDWLNGFIGNNKLTFPMMVPEKELLVVRRTASLGDVLAATCVARFLNQRGYDVEWQAAASMYPVLRRVPEVKVVTPPDSPPDVDLDGAYETHPDRCTRHFADLFTDRANAQLEKRNIFIDRVINFAPVLVSDEKIAKPLVRELKKYPKPWVMIVPKSWSWVNRTVPDPIWKDAASLIDGTCFWLGPNVAPEGIVDLQCRDVEFLIEYLAAADLVISPDTGPLHIAVALRTPSIAINQSSSPDVHLSDQRDWVKIEPPLECLNCQKDKCPIDAEKPPCQEIDPLLIAEAARLRIRSFTTDDVSAVVVVYKPKMEKLNRCLSSLLPQVEEIMVVGDFDTPILKGMVKHAKIKFLRLPAAETGYGRKATYGARHSNGRFIWFVNDDLYPDADVARKLLPLFKDEKVAIATHLLRYLSGELQYAGKARPPGHVGFGHIDHMLRHSRFTEPVEQEAACGASMIIRRKVFFEVDGFDESYFLYSEDDSLSMEVRRAGYKIMFSPLAEGIHEEHQSSKLRGDSLAPVLKESHEVFMSKWRDYFRHNPDINKIGNFNYLKK